MPNYSKARTLFSSVNKKLWDIPWEECHHIYSSVREDMVAEKQQEIDDKYEEEIARMEQEYTNSHEAPYEGNFSDQLPKPPVVIPLAELEAKISTRLRTEFIEKYKLILHMDWVMPQIVTYIGGLTKYKNDNGLYSGMQFRSNFKTDAEKGLYRFLMVNERSSYLKLQYKDPSRQYCALVPLILYAHRLVDGTAYSAWDRAELMYVVNTELYDAMVCTVPSVTREELIKIREEGTKEASGKAKNPLTCHMLFGSYQKLSEIGDMPKLAKVMMTQIWCAHPANRSRYMVLNPKNWDKMPPVLVDTEVAAKPDPSQDVRMAVLDDF
jgi:hypothetical protein